MAFDLSYWLFRLRSGWRWYRGARTRYDVHGPFLSELLERVMRDQRPFHAFDLVQQLRQHWAGHPGSVPVLDQGAPSKITNDRQRRVSELVTASAIGPTEGELLFRLALWVKPKIIVELGTNAGISTLYLHYADRRADLHTIEGNPHIAGLAKRTFELARCAPTLRQHVGTFADVLPGLLNDLPEVDLLFIDGDHRYEPTLEYFELARPKLKDTSVVVIADVHWSVEMEKAWAELRRHPAVTASLDVYHFGILFFRPGLGPGQHVDLIATRYKPWRMGFFA